MTTKYTLRWRKLLLFLFLSTIFDLSSSTFMLAGHETTSGSITWALFELARRPKVQDALREEIIVARASLGQKRRIDFTSADLDELPLLNAVVKVLPFFSFF